MNEPEKRRASRLIVIDSEKKILLFRHARRSGETFWAPPGGGLEEGEAFEQAALREASEELGMHHLSLTSMWEQMTDFVYIERPVRQQERFFHVEGDLAGLLANVQEVHKQESILETRWWVLADLESTNEKVFPSDLCARVGKLLR